MKKQSRKLVTTKLNPNTKKDLLRALDRFSELLQLGYTDENFIDLSRCLNTIRRHVAVQDSKQLESYWRDSYTDLYDEDSLNHLLDRIRTDY